MLEVAGSNPVSPTQQETPVMHGVFCLGACRITPACAARSLDKMSAMGLSRASGNPEILINICRMRASAGMTVVPETSVQLVLTENRSLPDQESLFSSKNWRDERTPAFLGPMQNAVQLCERIARDAIPGNCR